MAFPTNAIVVAGKQSTNSNSTGNTVAADTTSANHLTCFVAGLATGIPQTITDVGATQNTWTKKSTHAGTAWLVEVWQATQPVNTNALHQVGTSSVVGSLPVIVLVAESGAKSSLSFDTFSENGSGTSASVTTLKTGNLIPSQGAEVIYAVMAGGIASATESSGTEIIDLGFSGTAAGVAISREVQTSYINRNVTFTFTSQQGAAAIVSLRSASGGTPNRRLKGISGATCRFGNTPALFFERTQAYTASAVISKVGKPSAGGAAVVYTTYTQAGQRGHEFYIDENGRIHVRLINTVGSNWIDRRGTTDITDGLDHIVAVTYDGSSTAAGVKVYVDGALETMVTEAGGDTLNATIIIAGQELYLANQEDGSANTTYFLSINGTGCMTKFILSNVERSGAYVAANLASVYTMPTKDANSLIWLPCADDDGTTVADASGNGYNGTLSTASMLVGDAATVPGAPVIGTAAVVNTTTVNVPFTEPSDGGSTILDFTAISNVGSFSGTLYQAGSGTVVVTGAFASGISYTFTVTARNIKGSGSASSVSNAVTPNPAPTAPPLNGAAGSSSSPARSRGDGSRFRQR